MRSATSRILQGITAGLGFIGGGVIMRRTVAGRAGTDDRGGNLDGARLASPSARGSGGRVVALTLTLIVLVVGKRSTNGTTPARRCQAGWRQ